jgi:hypothetical protein
MEKLHFHCVKTQPLMNEQVINITACMDKMAPYMSAPAPTSIAPRPVRRCSSLGATKIIFFAGSLKQVLHNLNVDGRVEGVDIRRQCTFFEEALVEIKLQESRWP